MRAVLVTGPASEPISLNDAKVYLRIDSADEDDYVTELITTARLACENYTNRAFISQQWDLWLDEWPVNKRASSWWDGVREGAISEMTNRNSFLELPRPPLISIQSVNTYDETDTAALWAAANYFVDTKNEPGRLALRVGSVWPVFIKSANGVQISYTAGYGTDKSSVPKDIIQAIKQTMSHFYENRGDQSDDLPMGAKVLLERYRIARL